MAVQKNFIVRNGLEVNNNLLVADSSTDYVGIGTSSPKYTLEVIGGIGVTYTNVLGIATVGQEFNVGTGGTVITSLDTGLTGFGTAIPAYVVDIRSPVSTGQTALYVQGDVRVTGDLYADDINFDQATLNNLEVTGVGTIATASIDLGYVNTGIVTNLVTTGIASVAVGVITDAYVTTGIVTNLITSGIGSITIAAIRDGYINTGIVTNLVTTGIASVSVGVITDAYVTTGIVTNLVTTGIASIATGVVTDAYVTTGIVTTISGTTLNYSGIGTITTLNATNVNVSGVTTTGELSVNDVFNVYAPNATFHNDLIIDGNVTIGGTSAILNAVQVRVEDKDIILGFTTAIPPSDDTANHGGVAIASTEGSPLVSLAVVGINTLPDTYKQIMWVKKDTMGAGTTDAFLFNYAVGVGSTQVPDGARLAVGSIHFTDNEIDTTNLYVTGVSTIAAAVVDAAYVNTGIITTLSGSNLSYIGIVTAGSVSIGATTVISAGRELQNIASLDATTTATIEAAIVNAPNTFTDLVIAGIASINVGVFTSLYSPTGIITTLSGTNIDYSGIGSFGGVNADFANVNTGIVTNLTTSGIASVAVGVITDAYVTTGIVTNLTTSGIASVAVGVVTDAYVTTGIVTNLNVSAASTIGTVQISSGIVTATSGIVTYYGDGSNLTGLATGLTATIGVSSTGTFVGAGISQLDFRTNANAVLTVDNTVAGLATVTIAPSVSLGLVIALGG